MRNRQDMHRQDAKAAKIGRRDKQGFLGVLGPLAVQGAVEE